MILILVASVSELETKVSHWTVSLQSHQWWEHLAPTGHQYRNVSPPQWQMLLHVSTGDCWIATIRKLVLNIVNRVGSHLCVKLLLYKWVKVECFRLLCLRNLGSFKWENVCFENHSLTFVCVLFSGRGGQIIVKSIIFPFG